MKNIELFAGCILLICAVFVLEAKHCSAQEMTSIEEELNKKDILNEPDAMRVVFLRCSSVSALVASYLRQNAKDREMSEIGKALEQDAKNFLAIAMGMSKPNTDKGIGLQLDKITDIYSQRWKATLAKKGNFHNDPVIMSDLGYCKNITRAGATRSGQR